MLGAGGEVGDNLDGEKSKLRVRSPGFPAQFCTQHVESRDASALGPNCSVK